MSPDGITHHKAWRFFIPIPFCLSMLLLAFGYWYLSVWVMLGYCIHGIGGITNDLDLISVNSDEARWIKSVILIPIFAWSTLYARIMQGFGGHRSVASHGFIISSFIRLVWFGLPAVLLFYKFFSGSLYVELFGIFMGLCIADSIHTILDMGTGEMRFGRRGKIEIVGWFIKIKFGFPYDKKEKK